MNLVQVQNRLRDLSDQQLQSTYAQNSGEVPPFLVLAETKRRQDMRQAGAGQAAAMQGAKPSIAEQIMQPAQPALAGPPMGQSGLPQMQQAQPAQAAPQGGIQSFKHGGAVHKFSGGGSTGSVYSDPYTRESMEEDDENPLIKLIRAIPSLLRPDAGTPGEPQRMQREEQYRKQVAAAQAERDAAAENAQPARVTPLRQSTLEVTSPSPARSVPVQPRPNAGITSLEPTVRDQQEEMGPPSPLQGITQQMAQPPAPRAAAGLEALREQAMQAQANTPKAFDMYQEMLKGAPKPGANVQEMLQQQQGTLDSQLKQAQDARLQNFFLQLAGGQSQRALSNIGGALVGENEGFNKTSKEIGDKRAALLLELAKSKDSGDGTTFQRQLEQIKYADDDRKTESGYRTELARIEKDIASATNDADRLKLEQKKERTLDDYRRSQIRKLDAEASGGGKKARSPEQVNKDVTSAVETARKTMNSDPGGSLVRDQKAKAAGHTNFITFYDNAVRKAFEQGAATAPSIQDVERMLGGGSKPAGGAPDKITSKAQYDGLPSGTRFTAPDGTVRTKP